MQEVWSEAVRIRAMSLRDLSIELRFGCILKFLQGIEVPLYGVTHRVISTLGLQYKLKKERSVGGEWTEGGKGILRKLWLTH
jgi:hypothetical protein